MSRIVEIGQSDDCLYYATVSANVKPGKRFILRAGGAGDVKMDFASGETRTIAVEDGEIVYAQATKLYASGTTATGIKLYTIPNQ